MEINFTDYINDAVRILILLNAAKSRKSLVMTERKIMLFDYYLKFPHTMLSDLTDISCDLQTLDEYYAFFHWQPDIIRYRRSINYLIAKGFVEKGLDKNQTVLSITDLGEKVVGQINSTYKKRMEKITLTFLPMVAKLSDSKIEGQIRNKSNILLRNGGGNHEKEIKD
jgi:hypothetical protein